VGKITLMWMQPWREVASCVTSALDNVLEEVATAGIRARRQHWQLHWTKSARRGPSIPVLGTPGD
jgi:hypothetical protein